jgi:hypothetical protein
MKILKDGDTYWLWHDETGGFIFDDEHGLSSTSMYAPTKIAKETKPADIPYKLKGLIFDAIFEKNGVYFNKMRFLIIKG